MLYCEIPIRENIQFSIIVTLASEREDIVRIVQMMEEKFGSDWLEVALKISTLAKQDILELKKGLACKEDIVRIYSVSRKK